MTDEIDFDFARYIAARRGQVEQRARDAGVYAYSGELRVRRNMNTVRPVTMAIEATTRLWKNVAKTELLGTSVQVTDQQFPQVFEAIKQAAYVFRMRPPSVYVLPATSSIKAKALGTNDDAYIVINSQLLEYLNDRELLSLVGHELAHIHNNQVLYATALHYLNYSAGMFVRWAVQPAIMSLQAWSRRAEITCDRGALLCTRDLDVTLGTLVKIAMGLEGADHVNIDDYLQNLPTTSRGLGRFAELFRSHPYLPKRVRALRLFAESKLYKKHLGEDAEDALSADAVDAQVSEIISVF